MVIFLCTNLVGNINQAVKFTSYFFVIQEIYLKQKNMKIIQQIHNGES